MWFLRKPTPQLTQERKERKPLVPFHVSEKGVVSLDADDVVRAEKFQRNMQAIARIRLLGAKK